MRSASLEALFPPGVVAFARQAPGDPATLLPAERALASRFVPKRLAEFAAGRACARAAFAAFGAAATPILSRADRSPVWPPGLTGSISHTDGYCAAIAARSARFLGVGLDVERDGRVSRDLWQHLFTEDERARLESMPDALARRAASVAFCAKEAFYKAQFAVTESWVDFHDVAVEIEDPGRDAGDFTLRAVTPGAVARRTLPLTGRYEREAGRVAAGVAIVAADGA